MDFHSAMETFAEAWVAANTQTPLTEATGQSLNGPVKKQPSSPPINTDLSNERPDTENPSECSLSRQSLNDSQHDSTAFSVSKSFLKNFSNPEGSLDSVPDNLQEWIVRKAVLELIREMSQNKLAKLCPLSRPMLSNIINNRHMSKIGKQKCQEFGNWYLNYRKQHPEPALLPDVKAKNRKRRPVSDVDSSATAKDKSPAKISQLSNSDVFPSTSSDTTSAVGTIPSILGLFRDKNEQDINKIGEEEMPNLATGSSSDLSDINTDDSDCTETDSENESHIRLSQSLESSFRERMEPWPSIGHNSSSNDTHSFILPDTNRTPSPLPYSSTWLDEKPDVKPILFIGKPGMKIPLTPEKQSPLDYFLHIFTDELVDLIIKETNNHAPSVLMASSLPSARISKWKDLTRGEFYIFIAMLFHMGVIVIGEMSDYWRNDCFFSLPFFSASNMSRDRFMLILRCLHFASNINPNKDDRLWKVRPILDFFNKRMEEVYEPVRELNIDESVILWRGQLTFKKYIAKKKHKYGVKIYRLCESTGTVLKLRIYSGAAESCRTREQGHAYWVVDSLVENLKKKGHSIYMDNYFTSLNLARHLLNNDLYCTGTLKANRKENPEDVVTKKLKLGEVVQKFSPEGICVLKWRDRREVIMLSSEHTGEKKHKTNRKGTDVERPEAVLKYNDFMSGIDRLDQLMSYTLTTRKTIRRYKKVALHVMQIMLINSHNLFRKYSPQKSLNLKDYRLAIIGGLLDYGKALKETKKPSHLNFPKSQSFKKIGDLFNYGKALKEKEKPFHLHFPKFQPFVEGRGLKRKQKVCRVCTSNKIRKQVNTYCPDCEDEPGLCLDPCFKKFHDRID